MADQTQQRLQSMLKWSLRMQDDVDNSATEKVEMSEERRQWLKECLEAVCNQPSETDLLKAALAVLKAQYTLNTSDSSNKLQDAFDQLLYLVEDLDHAKDLIPLKGVETVIQYLHHHDSDLQICACDVTAAATQNLPECQEAFLPSLPQLLHLIDDKNTNGMVKVKAVYALSGMVRGHAVCVKEFQKQNGISCLLNCLQLYSSNNKKLTTKVCYLLRALFLEPDDTLLAEGERIAQSILKRLLEDSDDSELKALYCVTLSAVTAPTGYKLLMERAREVVPVLKTLKDELEDDESTKDVIKELLLKLEK